MNTLLEDQVCPQCGDQFSVYAIKFAGLDPHETDDGELMCSDRCMIEHLEEKIKENKP